MKRAREIGNRKVVGAHRGQIVRQFLSEAVVVALPILLLALFTIGSQTVKAGLTNPVDSLRDE